MVIKLIGAAVLIASSAIYGIHSAQLLEKRLAQIKDLRTGLNSLKQEIYLCGVPLGKAMENASAVMTTEVASMLASCGRAVTGHNGCTVKDQILGYMNEPEILLCDQSKNILIRWASSAGGGDIKAEYDSLEYAVSQLDELISKTEQECEKKARLYRSSGVLIGAFIVAVLL